MRKFDLCVLPFTVLAAAAWVLVGTVHAAPPESRPQSSCPSCKRAAAGQSQPAQGGAQSQKSDAGGAPKSGRSPTPAQRQPEGCCWRYVAQRLHTPPRFSIERGDWGSVFTKREFGGGPLLEDCPPRVDTVVDTHDGNHPSTTGTEPEYAFVGDLVVDEKTDQCRLSVQLVDLLHGAVVKREQASWRIPASPVAGFAHKVVGDQMIEVARRFQPLDDILYEYEGTPRSAELQPEKDPIGAGKKMTIHLTNILADTRGGQPQPWQRVLVKVEKGQLLNGTPQGDREWNFPVGKGTIELKYQAPDECQRKQTETITVFNTCTIDPKSVNISPEEQIASTTFDVVCVRGEFEFQYDCVLSRTGGLNIKNDYKHSVPFWVNFDKDPPTIEGEGQYSNDLTIKQGTLGGNPVITVSETPGGPRVFDLVGGVRLQEPGRNASALGTYTRKGFKQVEKSTNKKKLFGELIKDKSGDESLKWGYVETFARGGPATWKYPWIFPLKDGYKREWPMEITVAGNKVKQTFSVTLHLQQDD